MISWSILAHLYPCGNASPNRVSFFTQYFHEFNIDGFDFSNEFKCSDVYQCKKLNNLSINIFESGSYQEVIDWKHILIPIEFS